MSDVPPSEETFALLGDEYARAILIATRNEHMTASALADELDAVPSPVYDRIEGLEAAGFLAEVTPDGFDLVASYRDYDEPAARLHALWSDLR